MGLWSHHVRMGNVYKIKSTRWCMCGKKVCLGVTDFQSLLWRSEILQACEQWFGAFRLWLFLRKSKIACVANNLSLAFPFSWSCSDVLHLIWSIRFRSDWSIGFFLIYRYSPICQNSSDLWGFGLKIIRLDYE